MKRPNILYIMSDQHRADFVGVSETAYPVRTPNLDRLAAQGLRFSSAYTPHPLCCPARQCLLNGRRAESFGSLWNFDLGSAMKPLAPTDYSWPRQLREEGYRNGFVGKWHVNPDVSPLGFGFEEYVSNGDHKRFLAKAHPEVTFSKSFFGEPNPLPVEHSETHWLAARAMELIERFAETGSPWHVRLDFTDPHLPCRPVEPFASMYKPEEVPVWPTFAEDFAGKPYIQRKHMSYWGVENYTWDDWSKIVARYYGIVTQMDDAIGLVLAKLDELGLADDTIVVYTSDHGDMCGSHRLFDKHYVMYDDIVKVPLIVRWPQHIHAGLVCDEFVYNALDMPPTLLEMAGGEVPGAFAGRSLVPFLQGEKVGDWRQEVLASYNGQMFGLYSQRMIRDRKFKYVWNGTEVDELYELQADPHELRNLSQDPQYREVIAERRKKMYRILLQDGDKLMNNRWMDRHFNGLAEL
jgi:arylsulfatase A-like enzyme